MQFVLVFSSFPLNRYGILGDTECSSNNTSPNAIYSVCWVILPSLSVIYEELPKWSGW